PRSDAEIFSKIDVDKVIKSENIDRLGRETGEKELPPTNATPYDANESKIILKFKDELSESYRKAKDKIAGLNNRISKIDINPDFQNIENLPEKIKKQAANLINEFGSRLITVKEARDQLSLDLKEFQSTNNLSSLPDYPESKFLSITILVAIVFIESVGNGYFFAKGNEFGFLGGYTQALIVASANVAFAFFWGYLAIPQMNSVNKTKKYLGIISIPTYLLIAISFNLFVAHYRDELSLSFEGANFRAISAFLETPFFLKDFDSFILLFIGLIISGIALIDGYKFDDKYPGYGRIYRRYKEAERKYHLCCSNIVKSLHNLKNQSLEELDDLSENYKKDYNHLNIQLSTKNKLIDLYEQHYQHLEGVCDVVLKHYQHANSSSRKTPAPKYFDENFSMPAKTELITEDEMAGNKDSQSNYKDKMVRLKTLYGKTGNNLQEIYRNCFGEFEKIDMYFRNFEEQ
ncbi:MAG: hypothetical protein KAR17_16480, partial [Cyclobacteriaceae bacterium]|nr:hypothetical protein [Cyclobacteriaceae bacterium]